MKTLPSFTQSREVAKPKGHVRLNQPQLAQIYNESEW